MSTADNSGVCVSEEIHKVNRQMEILSSVSDILKKPRHLQVQDWPPALNADLSDDQRLPER